MGMGTAADEDPTHSLLIMILQIGRPSAALLYLLIMTAATVSPGWWTAGSLLQALNWMSIVTERITVQVWRSCPPADTTAILELVVSESACSASCKSILIFGLVQQVGGQRQYWDFCLAKGNHITAKDCHYDLAQYMADKQHGYPCSESAIRYGSNWFPNLRICLHHCTLDAYFRLDTRRILNLRGELHNVQLCQKLPPKSISYK